MCSASATIRCVREARKSSAIGCSSNARVMHHTHYLEAGGMQRTHLHRLGRCVHQFVKTIHELCHGVGTSMAS